MERRQFTDEFECEAVRFVSQAGISKEEISKDLGIKPTCFILGCGSRKAIRQRLLAAKTRPCLPKNSSTCVVKPRSERSYYSGCYGGIGTTLIAFPARLAPPLVMPVSRSLIL